MITSQKSHKIKVTLEFQLYENVPVRILEDSISIGFWKHPEEPNQSEKIERFMPFYVLREAIEKAIDNSIADDDLPVCITSMEVENIDVIEHTPVWGQPPNITCQCGNPSVSGKCYHCMRSCIDDDPHPSYV